MSAPRALLNDFIPFSNVDGPGNRFVLFFQGCNFDCSFCHNPYTISTCIDCEICIEPCPEDALFRETDGSVTVDWDRCTRCDICVDVCPYDSTPLAKQVTVDEIFSEIRTAAPFLSGITVSGGEATLQPEFVAALFSELKAHPDTRHLTTFVDSNGSCTSETWDVLLPVMDSAMIDIKALDDNIHIALTGVSNSRVLDSIRYLARRDRLHEVRLPLISGVNDSDELLTRTARWLASVDPALRIKVIGFRKHGVRAQYQDLTEPTADQMEHCEQVLSAAGAHEIVRL
ncbi:MAG: YjjW family glycine radical enzyme activase [Gammaproteobacteria bacterium]|nr:YjjW family glycine radical enzyme activase [Gammaproteobacteria bacterium]